MPGFDYPVAWPLGTPPIPPPMWNFPGLGSAYYSGDSSDDSTMPLRSGDGMMRRSMGSPGGDFMSSMANVGPMGGPSGGPTASPGIIGGINRILGIWKPRFYPSSDMGGFSQHEDPSGFGFRGFRPPSMGLLGGGSMGLPGGRDMGLLGGGPVGLPGVRSMGLPGVGPMDLPGAGPMDLSSGGLIGGLENRGPMF